MQLSFSKCYLDPRDIILSKALCASAHTRFITYRQRPVLAETCIKFIFLPAVQPREQRGAGKGHLGVAVLTPILLPSLGAPGLTHEHVRRIKVTLQVEHLAPAPTPRRHLTNALSFIVSLGKKTYGFKS